VGLARAGEAAVRALHARGETVSGYDLFSWRDSRTVAEAIQARGGHVQLGSAPDPIALLDREPRPAAVVKSPGAVPGFEPVATALGRGLPVLDELELGWRLDPRPVVAVTGTNGKSTVCALLMDLLAAAGRRPVLAGNTSFGPPLSAARDVEGDVLVLEVSSNQLEGCSAFAPELAVHTGLSPDHLRRHGSMQRYAEAKRRMFFGPAGAVARAAVRDDEEGRRLAGDLREAGSAVVTFGHGSGADVRARELCVTTPLIGAHNAVNVAAAVAVGKLLEIDPGSVAEALADSGRVPGRLERIDHLGGFEAYVDYAHNPDGVVAVLTALRDLGQGRLVVVMSVPVTGAQEQRDMGREAAQRADVLVLTTERFLPSAPLTPPAELLEGAAEASFEVVEGRARAIARGVELCRPGDVLAVLGRGSNGGPLCEFSRDEAGPFDDREQLRAALAASWPCFGSG